MARPLASICSTFLACPATFREFVVKEARMLRGMLIGALALGGICRSAYAQDVDHLIRALGSDDPQSRERAMADLRAAGAPCRPILEKALRESRDPEIRTRLESLLLAYR